MAKHNVFEVRLESQVESDKRVTVAFDYLNRLWTDEATGNKVSLEELQHRVMPNVQVVVFGELRMSTIEWQACGSPLLLTKAELTVIEQTINYIKALDRRGRVSRPTEGEQ